MTALAQQGTISRSWRPTPDIVRDTTLLVGLLVGLGQASGLVFHPIDAVIYWNRTADLANVYPVRMGAGAGDFFLYPPPMAQLLAPLHVLPERAWWIVSSVLSFGAIWYMAGRWTPVFLGFGVLTLAGLDTPLGAPLMYALLGNVQLVMAAAIVAGMIRHPGWWSIVLLTKTGPGIGLLWFVVRRDWRNLGLALGVTALVVAVSFALGPQLWFDWIGFVSRNADMSTVLPVVPVPFAIRLAMSAVLIVWGARTDRLWTVPIAAGWAIPVLYAGSFLPVWLGAVRLSTLEVRRERPVTAQQPAGS